MRAKRTKDEKNFLFRFGGNLRTIRNNKGWTLEQAEDEGWNHWEYLQRIEVGKKDIGILTLRKLSLFYQVKLTDIVKNLKL